MHKTMVAYMCLERNFRDRDEQRHDCARVRCCFAAVPLIGVCARDGSD